MKMRLKFEKVLSIILTFSLLLSMLPTLVLHVHATTIDILDGKISISDTQSNVSNSNETVTATATGSIISKKTNTVTITNNSGNKAKISFDYSATNQNSLKIDNVSVGEKGTITEVLDAGNTITIALQSKSGFGSPTATLVLNNFSCTLVKESNITLKFNHDECSVFVNGSSITTGYNFVGADAQIEVITNEGYNFVGWKITSGENTGNYFSFNANTTHSFSDDVELSAVFTSSSATKFGVGTVTSQEYKDYADFVGSLAATTVKYYNVTVGLKFNDLNDAALYAAGTDNKYVVLLENTVLSAGTYNIPQNVTLLIPFDSNNTLYTDAACSYSTYTTPSAFRTLTLAEGANLEVQGAISVSGKHMRTAAGQMNGSAPTGPQGFIALQSGSMININSGGALYAWGYITGEGKVSARSGSKIYELFQISDFRGGSQSTVSSSTVKGVFPISQYYVQNIESELLLYAGAIEYAYTTIYMNHAAIASPVAFIGSSGSMFNMGAGSYVSKKYDGSTDRMILKAYGNISVDPIKLPVGSSSINSNDYVLPITNNFTVTILTGSNVTMNQKLALLPGSRIIIESDATCTIGSGKSIYVYDQNIYTNAYNNTDYIAYIGKYCWGNIGGSQQNIAFAPIKYAPGRKYTRTINDLTDAEILVSGTVDASAGYIYTTDGGASVKGTEGAVVIYSPGTETVTYQILQNINGDTDFPVEIPITSPVLTHGDGTTLSTPAIQKNYTYKDDKWVCKVDDNEHTYEILVTAPTCTEQGYTTHTCSTCGDSYVDTYVDALGHSYNEGVVTPPTCTEQGYTTHTCSICGDSYKDTYVDALGHSYNEGVVTPPTCTEQGYTTYTCSCGDSYKGTYVDALGHKDDDQNCKCDTCDEQLDHDYDAVVTPPTCTEKGYTTYTCSVCGHTYKDAYVDALGHKYEASVTTEPTCTENGVKTFTCSVCGDSYTEAIEALGHSYGDGVVTTEPTCTEKGVKTFTCGTCGDSYTEDIAALGHKYESSITKDPTCTEKGVKTYTCSVCGDSYTEEVAELGHSYNAVVTDPTCTGKGFTTHTCSTCGDSYVDTYVDALGHSYDDGVVTTEPTCTEKGVKTFTCGTCDDSYTEEIDAVGHSYDAVVTAPTCTEQGYTTHTCSTCGDSYVDSYVDALGHSYNAVVTDPTCTEQGYTTYTCSCGDSYVDDYVDALGHSYDAVVTDPTCTEQGYTTYTCSCGDSYVDDYVDALGHKDENNNCKCDTCDEQLDHDYDAVVTAPTCTDKGYTTHTCSICKDSYVDSYVDALGHSYNAVVTDPTCTEQGYTTYTCSCGDSYVDNYVDALGHKDENNNCKCDTCDEQLDHDYNAVVTDPTCTEQGFTTHTCSVCGNSYVDTYVDALGHSYDDGVVTTEPACTEKGVKTFTCGTCGDGYTEEIDAVGHSYDAVVTAPTCTEQGYTTYTCSACGDSYVDDYVDALGHSYNAVVTDPTCTEQGYTTYTCSCGDSYVDTYVDALGHSYDEGVVTTEPTCTENGVKTYTCSVCGDSYTEEVAELGHSYNAVVTDPTCTEQGFTTHTCSTCGDSYVDTYVDALGHSYDAVVTDPTCTEQGYTTYTCSCGDSYVDDYVDALGHSYDEGVVTTEPTCTEKGVKTFTCSVCGDSYTEDIAALGHSYNAVVTPPTCTEEGYTTYTCSTCKDSYEVDFVDALGHKDENHDHVCDNGCDVYHGIHADSTEDDDHVCDYGCGDVLEACIDEDHDHACDNGCDVYHGIHADSSEDEDHVCDYGCGDVLEDCDDVDNDNDHNCDVCGKENVTEHVFTYGEYVWNDDNTECTITRTCNCTLTETANAVITSKVTTPATCEGKGWTTYTATFTEGWATTQTKEVEDVAALGHSYDAVVTDPTCTEQGYTTHTCSICKEGYEDTYVDATGHSYNEGVITTNPTCTEKGVKTFTCSACGDSYTEEIDALGHSYNAVVTAPTCTDKGYTTHTCSCGDSYVDTYVAALGHKYESSITKDPTCTEKGVKTFTCSVCGDSYTEEIDALGHSYDAVVTAPTCTEQGFTTHTCSPCGNSYVDNYVDALGHSYDDGVVTTDPTCTEKGVKTFTCSVCGDSYTEEIDALGHSYNAVVTAPTCTEKGYTTYTCQCGDNYIDDYIDANGHTHGWFEYDLYKHWSVCSVAGCGASYDEDEHVFVNDSCECGARRVSVDKVGNSDIDYVVIGQTVTVTHEDACTVAYISNGEYVKLEAIANDDGSYSFVAPDGVNEVKLFVIGDYDGDGALTDDDATSLKNALLEKETLNDTPVFVYDVNGDQKITAIDLALISAAAQRSINLDY